MARVGFDRELVFQNRTASLGSMVKPLMKG